MCTGGTYASSQSLLRICHLGEHEVYNVLLTAAVSWVQAAQCVMATAHTQMRMMSTPVQCKHIAVDDGSPCRRTLPFHCDTRGTCDGSYTACLQLILATYSCSTGRRGPTCCWAVSASSMTLRQVPQSSWWVLSRVQCSIATGRPRTLQTEWAHPTQVITGLCMDSGGECCGCAALLCAVVVRACICKHQGGYLLYFRKQQCSAV